MCGGLRDWAGGPAPSGRTHTWPGLAAVVSVRAQSHDWIRVASGRPRTVCVLAGEPRERVVS